MMDDLQKTIFQKNLIFYLGNKSQAEVAKAIGVSPQTFNTWCQGIAIPRMDKIQKLADYFCINKSDLIEEHNLDDAKITINADNELVDFIEKFNKATPDQKKMILGLADTVLRVK